MTADCKLWDYRRSQSDYSHGRSLENTGFFEKDCETVKFCEKLMGSFFCGYDRSATSTSSSTFSASSKLKKFTVFIVKVREARKDKGF